MPKICRGNGDGASSSASVNGTPPRTVAARLRSCAQRANNCIGSWGSVPLLACSISIAKLSGVMKAARPCRLASRISGYVTEIRVTEIRASKTGSAGPPCARPRAEIIDGGDCAGDGFWWYWMADEVSLCFGAAHLAEHLQLTHAFNSLGNDVEAH